VASENGFPAGWQSGAADPRVHAPSASNVPGLKVTRAEGAGTLLAVTVPIGVDGAGVVGTGVVGGGELGVGVLGVGVGELGAGVGVGLPGGVGEWLGVPGMDEGAGDANVDSADPDGWGVAAARATAALPPLGPSPRVAATGLCRGRPLGAALFVAAGGATSGS
jgi:hypothetical protein